MDFRGRLQTSDWHLWVRHGELGSVTIRCDARFREKGLWVRWRNVTNVFLCWVELQILRPNNEKPQAKQLHTRVEYLMKLLRKTQEIGRIPTSAITNSALAAAASKVVRSIWQGHKSPEKQDDTGVSFWVDAYTDKGQGTDGIRTCLVWVRESVYSWWGRRILWTIWSVNITIIKFLCPLNILTNIDWCLKVIFEGAVRCVSWDLYRVLGLRLITNTRVVAELWVE